MPPRSPEIGSPLDKALASYCAQASALAFSVRHPGQSIAHTAAVGAALALAPAADAAIQYSGAKNILLPSTHVGDNSINLNSAGPASLVDSSVDFIFDINVSSVAFVKPDPFNGLGYLGIVRENAQPARLSDGATISAASTVGSTTLIGGLGGNWNGGTMSAGAAGFLGVGFNIANGSVTNLHYGWIRVGIETNGSGQPVAMTIYDWAWETAPDTQIVAGVIPEPSTAAGLALLATGAAGLAAWRRRKPPKT
ncbi:MAG TPA: PEP-CTERM sorting domain-containing protein [Verrucomicrobiae bacterium]|nr:PEP-CTERM sorting domain-containing protein [Verrucomicrobiae bacterium]